MILYERRFLLRGNVLHCGTNQIGIYSVVPRTFCLLQMEDWLTWSLASGTSCSTGWTPNCLITWLMISAIRVMHS